MKKNLVVVGYGGMGGWHTQHAQKSDVVNLLGIYDIHKLGSVVYLPVAQLLSDAFPKGGQGQLSEEEILTLGL